MTGTPAPEAARPFNLAAIASAAVCAGALVFGVGGTVVGDHVIANYVHGDTRDKTTALCSQTFARMNVTPGTEMMRGCILEKERGFKNASAAHVKVRLASYATMAVFGSLAFSLRRRKNAEPR